MYPYITRWTSKIYMTGVGIILAFITLIIVVLYLSKKNHQSFWRFFYWLPLFTIFLYILGSMATLLLEKGASPISMAWIIKALSPYGYKFHFLGTALWAIISLLVFFRRIIRIENKKIRWDILFFGFGFALIPLGIFFILWDNVIGLPTESFLGIKALHADSQLNKFNAVFPVGIFLSIGAIISVLVISILKMTKKKIWYGMLGFAMLLLTINITFLFQQYPRYGVISLGSLTLDIKNYAAFLMMLRCLYLYNKRIHYDSSPSILDEKHL